MAGLCHENLSDQPCLGCSFHGDPPVPQLMFSEHADSSPLG